MSLSITESLNLTAGALISGRFEIVKNIGSGSMGVVYQCRDKQHPNRKLAIKVLYPELARDDTGLARFQNEILAAHKVVHRNVVQPFDYIEDGELKAYTMEYVQGIDLSKFIEREKPLSIGQVVDLLVQMCQGVEAIHQAGIVHRDLKPENVMISDSGDAKIMDFGIARAGAGRNITPRGSILGTFEYMSPEYLSDGIVNRSGDIYSVGVIGYEMLTGRLPHRGGSLVQIIQAKVRYQPQPPKEIRPDCPPVLNEMILRALRLEPSERFASAGEWNEQLLPLAPRTKAARKSTMELARGAFEEIDGLDKQPNSDSDELNANEDLGSSESEMLEHETIANEELSPVNQPRWDKQQEHQPELYQVSKDLDGELDRSTEFSSRPRGFLLRFLGLLVIFALVISGGVFVFGYEKLFAFAKQGVAQVSLLIDEHLSEKANVGSELEQPADQGATLVENVKLSCDVDRLAAQVESNSIEELERVSPEGTTILSRAAESNCYAIVDMLLGKGVKINQKLPSGVTAYEVARNAGATESIKLLELAGASR